MPWLQNVEVVKYELFAYFDWNKYIFYFSTDKFSNLLSLDSTY